MHTGQHLWSIPVALDDIPDTGRHYDLHADAVTREAIARAAGIVDLPCLQAQLDVSRYGRQGLRVVGRVAATVVQTCVVTLDPLTSEVDEPVDLVFVQGVADSIEQFADADLDPSADTEPPEPLVGDTVDLGALAAEFLLLGIDPYPRKPDAVFAPPASPDANTDTGPFAGLAALKQQSGRKD